MKTHFKKMQNPNYLGSWDLYDNDGNQIDLDVTIEKVTKETVKNIDGKSDEVMTIHVKGHKPFICNSTNAKTIVQVTGSPFIEDWTGKSITLYVAQIRAFGAVHDALRVRTTPPKPKTLPEFTPDNPKWDAAKKAITNGTASIESIKKKFTISAKNEKLLTDGKI